MTAPAHAGGEPIRYAGATRYDTAAGLFGIYHSCGPGPYPNIVVASGEGYHDALAGNFLAGQGGNGGELLTQGSQLSTAAAARLRDATNRCSLTRPQRVVVVDGGAQIADATLAQIEATVAVPANSSFSPVPVQRIRGSDAYAAAALVATTPGATVGSTQKYGRAAIVASGENFPDALAASPLVYAQNMPLLFTRQGALPEVTADALRALNIQTVFLLGGTTAVAPAVETQLQAGHQVVRVAGANRQLTAIALADLAIADFAFADNLVHLARGDDYPDALAGGQVAAGGGQYHPILLTQSPTELSGHTAAYLSRRSPQLRGRVGVFGGTAAVSDATRQAAVRAASG